MCGGGGGDPGAEARRQESDRQARVTAATETINNVFNNKTQKDGKWVDGDPANSREKMYGTQKTAVYDLNKMDVDRQAVEAERANRFGLARSGLLGGSANVDSVADINRRTNEGLMKAGGIADQASADLRSADERARSNLLSMAQSGIDTGTAAQQAAKIMEVNSANAASARSGATIGKLFDDMNQAYLMRQIMQSQGGGGGGGGGYGASSVGGTMGGGQWFGVSNPRQSYGGS